MNLEHLAKITGVNLRHNFLPHGIASLIIVALTPVIFGISSLNQTLASQPLEMLLSLTGIVLLTPIFTPEQNETIRDVIRSKKTDYVTVCMLRVIYSVLFLALIFICFTIWMKYCSSDVTVRHCIGGLATALFLGSIGFCVSGISGNTIFGYMTAMLYYIMNFAMREELGHFHLFSMYMSAGSFDEKYWLLGSSFLLISFTFICISAFK